MVDAQGLGPCGRKALGVRLPSSALNMHEIILTQEKQFKFTNSQKILTKDILPYRKPFRHWEIQSERIAEPRAIREELRDFLNRLMIIASSLDKIATADNSRAIKDGWTNTEWLRFRLTGETPVKI